MVELRAQMRTSLFGQTPAHAWPENAELLEPLFWERASDKWKIAIQTWVVEVDGLNILVDTGAGNGKDRPHMPPLDHLDSDFLGALAEAGVQPDAVDVVINTHLHTDHIGLKHPPPRRVRRDLRGRLDAFMVDDWLELPAI